MKATYLFLPAAFLAITLLVTSCTNDEPDNGPVPVQFSTSIGQTEAVEGLRAAGTVWGATDVIGIYMFQGATYLAQNNSYTHQGSNQFAATSATSALFYPVDGTHVGFMAYYPRLTIVTGFVYPVDVSIQTSQPAIDLLYADKTAENYSKTNRSVTLSFNHKLVKLVLQPKAGDGIANLTGLTATIKGMKTLCDFNLGTGVLGTPDATSVHNITPFKTTDGNFEAIVLPVTVDNAGDVSVDFTLAGDTYTWTVPAATILAPGTKYTYEITINKKGVTVTGTITDWTAGPGGLTGEAW